MRSPFPTTDQMMPAADAVVELALLSLQPTALRWEKSVNMAITQLAWNAGCEGKPPLAMGVLAGDRALGRLLDELLQERLKRWAHLRCMVFDLDAHTSNGELVFTFALSWDGGEHCRPCEMTVDCPAAE